MIKYQDFIHPEDEAARQQLEAIPGFQTVAKYFIELGIEKMLHGLFMIFTKHFSRLIGKIPVAVNRVITLLFVNATWILFRAGSFGTLRAYLGALKSGGFGKPDENVLNAITPSYLSCFIQKMPCQWLWSLGLIAVVVCISLFAKNTQEQLEEKGLTAGKLVGCLLVGLLSLLSMSGVSTFLYAYF